MDQKRIVLKRPKSFKKQKIVALRIYSDGLWTIVLLEGIDGGMYAKYMLADAPSWVRKEVLGYE